MIQPLSDEQVEIIGTILQEIRSRTFFSKKRNEILQQLQLLKDVNNVRLLKFLILLVFDQDKEIAYTSSRLLNDIVINLGFEEIKWLDQFYRSSWYLFQLDFSFKNLSIEAINRTVMKNVYSNQILCILSMNESGYIREYAVKEFAKSADLKKVSICALRINDWIEQVRSVAMEGLLTILSNPKDFNSLIEAIPLFANIDFWIRDDSQKLKLKLRTVFTESSNLEQIRRRFLEHKNMKVKRELFRYMILDDDKISETIELGLKTKDAVILKICIEEINKHKPVLNLITISNLLSKSKSNNCRNASISLAKELLEHDDFIVFAKSFMFDKSFSVREKARYFLKEEGVNNFAEIYRKSLMNGEDKKIVCILGLKETSDSKDFELVKRYINEEKYGFRKASITTLCSFDFLKAKDNVIDFLCSNDISNSNLARKILSNNRIMNAVVKELLDICEFEGFEEHVYRNIIILFHYSSKWEGLAFYLIELNRNTNIFDELINYSLSLWVSNYNKSFINATEAQKNDIIEGYKKARMRVSESLTLYLDKTIETLIQN